MLRPLAGLAVIALIAGCASPAESPSPDVSEPAATALASPSASPVSSPAGGLRLVPAGPEEAFALTDPPFADGSSLEMTTVAPGPGGWVAAGGYRPFFSAGEESSDADAPFWFSPDGRTWERVGAGDPDLGGPGNQLVIDVVATAAGWWALGWSTTRFADPGSWAPRFWTSEDGRAWDPVVLEPCRLDICPNFLGRSARLRAMPDGSLLLLGTAGIGDTSPPAWWRLDGLAFVDGGLLPGTGDVPADESVYWFAVNQGDDGWVVLADLLTPDRRVLGWTSPDGAAWSQAPAARTQGLEPLAPLDVEAAGDRWIVVGANGLALVDGGGPDTMNDTAWLTDVVRVDDGYVAVGSRDRTASEDPWARWSADGTEWADVPIEGGSDEPPGGMRGAAFDGRMLVVVGFRADGAMAWSSGD